MPKPELDFAELLEKAGSKEWNEAIASRLEPMRAYLGQDEWTKGITPYFKALVANAMMKLIDRKSETRDVDYVRGFVACAKIVLSLPGSVDGQIQAEEKQKSERKDRGPTGYG